MPPSNAKKRIKAILTIGAVGAGVDSKPLKINDSYE